MEHHQAQAWITKMRGFSTATLHLFCSSPV